MKSVSRIALGMALALGGASVVAAPAFAQKKEEAPQSREFKFSKDERKAMAPVQEAIQAKDFATAKAGLPAAMAAAEGADARYVVGQFQVIIGRETQDTAMQAAGIEAMLASGVAAEADLPALYSNQVALAVNAQQYDKAEAALARWVEAVPNDPNAIAGLAEVKMDLKKPNEAAPLFARAIAAKKAAGEQVPEGWYKRALLIAYDNQMAPQSVEYGLALVTAYPTAENWRDALTIYQESGNLDPKTNVDLLRLKRAAKALAGERDYYELAQTLIDSGLPGEGAAVIREGVASRMIDGNKPMFKELLASATGRIADDKASLPGLETKAMAAADGSLALSTANAYLGYGEYAKAAALYRAALQKGSTDANLVNTRLGIALALAGQTAEAEAAFKAVTGPRAQLASYWMLWLSQRA